MKPYITIYDDTKNVSDIYKENGITASDTIKDTLSFK